MPQKQWWAWSLVGLLGFVHVPLLAQTLRSGTPLTQQPVCNDKVQLLSLTASNTAPTHGQSVTFTAQLKHLCTSGTANIPWKMTLGSTQVASGTAQNVAAGATVNVTYNWTADMGAYTLDAQADPANTLNESSTGRNNNFAPDSPALTVAGDWSGWATKAKAAAKSAFNSWFQQSEMTGITIPIAPTARGGTLKSTVDLNTTIRNTLTGQGVPSTVASAIAGGLSEGWNAWAATVKIQDLPLFPGLHMSAPSNPLPPSASGAPPPLLKVLQQSVTTMTSGSLAQAIKTKLGTLASEAGASVAMDDIAATANVCFSVLQGSAVVTNLMGGGPTTQNATNLAAGTVINGTAYVIRGYIKPPSYC